ncbi:FkbM family methyltransferase [Saccharolobus solfataricus]|uniref:FkbM family methyltransferase n=1 Tax=Saccharolobus solfataricus TaxID=2287 RepID=UPI00235164FC|nr:FkbM family methyltransferase [Saccharolobus solfataricus]
MNNQGDVKVPLYSIDNIRKMVKDPYLLKMDCEGCEADVILNSELDFEKIVFEAHPKLSKVSNRKIISKLEKEKYKCNSRMKLDETEIIYCEKVI